MLGLSSEFLVLSSEFLVLSFSGEIEAERHTWELNPPIRCLIKEWIDKENSHGGQLAPATDHLPLRTQN